MGRNRTERMVAVVEKRAELVNKIQKGDSLLHKTRPAS
jgi:hypothetical protein